MAAIIDWVRRALEPRYEIEREVARGGMGAVFRARDPKLGRLVAIKVLLPELATAEMADRFLREARLMAGLQHPHVVVIHEADESAGLFYYVMDFIEAPTLERRIRDGPLPTAEAVKLGRDLLDALESVHALGVVHRDVKPSNLFVSKDRTLLADFGIAKSTPDLTLNRTKTGQVVGTPEYMAPEQFADGEATAQADLYSASMVMYEALTGRRWKVGSDPRRADWSGVPHAIERVMSRGLAVDPQGRWPNAATFRRRLWHTRERPYRLRTALLVAAALTVGIVSMQLLRPGAPRPLPEEGLAVDIAVPMYSGPARTAWLRDSVPEIYARLIGSSLDFNVCTPVRRCTGAPTVTLRNTIVVTDSTFLLSVDYEGSGELEEVYRGHPQPLAEWTREVDRASEAGLRVIWTANLLEDWLPQDALPKSDAGFEAWLRAEQLLNRAQWRNARVAFAQAVQSDSTCYLCSWRITEIQRWLVEPPDPRHVRRTRSAIDRFPAHYQTLIELRQLSLNDRLRILDEATTTWPGFPYVWFLKGDELFHRGALSGRMRHEAVTAFQRATGLDPTFGPAWEHLASVSIAAGDAETARNALDEYDALAARSILQDEFARVIRALAELGYRSRFPAETASTSTMRVLSDFHDYPGVGAGPRYLAMFEVRDGMVDVARLLADHPHPNVRYSAGMAIVLARIAQGRVEEARKLLRELGRERSDVPPFALELDAALVLLDSGGIVVNRDTLVADLSFYERAGSFRGHIGAGWLRMLLQAKYEHGGRGRVDSLPKPLRVIVTSVLANDPATALERTGPDSLSVMAQTPVAGGQQEYAALPNAFYRTVLRFFRARWFAELNDPVDAATDLLFHEAVDLPALPTELPEAGEIDWAFSTLARWERARLLERITAAAKEVCWDYEIVARRWASGDPLYRARADSATRARERLGCDPIDVTLAW